MTPRIVVTEEGQSFAATVLSQTNAHTQASAHPPILTVLWFFEVLHVTAHHAKFLRIESENRSAELTYSVVLV